MLNNLDLKTDSDMLPTTDAGSEFHFANSRLRKCLSNINYIEYWFAQQKQFVSNAKNFLNKFVWAFKSLQTSVVFHVKKSYQHKVFMVILTYI